MVRLSFGYSPICPKSQAASIHQAPSALAARVWLKKLVGSKARDRRVTRGL